MKRHLGERLGNYRLIRLLGRGGFAEVYLGEQIYLHTQAAIKVLHVQLADKQIQAFLQEARTLAHLSHPHIVPVLDFAVQDGTPFLVLHYASRGNLRHLHPKDTCIPAAMIVSYVKQVASAVQFAHDRHFVHRDIKPENMLVGHHDAILLSDFGLAVVGESIHQQRFHDIAGTPQYMAPEQLQGHPCYASDQYALAAVVYEWLSGTPLFTGSSLEIMAQQLTASPPSLCDKIAGFPPDGEHVIFRALRKEPQQRFATVSDFASALEQALLPKALPKVDTQKHFSPLLRLPQAPARHVQQHVLVGRKQEYAQLFQLLLASEQQASTTPIQSISSLPLRRATSGRTCCVLLLGEAGIGKTRLVKELDDAAKQRGWAVVWSRGYAQESTIPYRLWIEIIRSAMEAGFWSPQEAETSPLLLQSLVPILPELASLLDGNKAQIKQREEQPPFPVHEAVLAVLAMICRRAPLLLVLDDVHWADEKSQELLGYVTRHLTDYPLLLLGTGRKQELTENQPLSKLIITLQRERVMKTLTLSALSQTEVRELLSHLPESLVQSIQHSAAGNPLFVEELARLFSEEDQMPDQKRVKRSANHQRTSLPATIQAVLDERLRRLSPKCQQLLQRAAVLQSSFSFITLQLMEYGQQMSPDGVSLLMLLEEALQADILIEEGTGAATSYRFWHPLLIDYLYTSLSTTRRTLLHQRAANVLRQLYAVHEDEGAASITYHLLAGGADPHHIAYYAERAAYRAYTFSAYANAEHYFQIALAQQAILLMDRERTHQESSLATDKYLHQAFLLECLGECLSIEGKFEETCKSYEHALMIHQQYDALASSHEEARDVQMQALLWCGIGKTWYDRNMFTHALQYYMRGEQMLKSAGIITSPVWAKLRLEQGRVRWQEGQYTEAHILAQEALVIFDEALQGIKDDPIHPISSTRLRRTLRGDPVDLGRAQMLLGIIANANGHIREAVVLLNASLTCFEQQGDQRELAVVCTNLGDVYLRKAEYEMAQALFERVLPIVEWMGDIPDESLIYLNLGLLAIRTGRLIEAETWSKKALFLAEDANERFYLCLGHAQLALVLYEQGKIDEGQASLQRAYALSQSLHIPLGIGLILVVEGQVQIAQILIEDEIFFDKDGSCMRRLSERGQGQLQGTGKMLRQVGDLEDLDVEMRIEAHLLLAQISFLLGDLEGALQQTNRTLKEADQIGLAWISVRIYRLLGSILGARGQLAEAYQYFERTAQQCQQLKMRLEYARTLWEWGKAQLQWDETHERAILDGWQRLQEARSILIECHAVLDLQQLERLLIVYTDTVVETPSREDRETLPES